MVELSFRMPEIKLVTAAAKKIDFKKHPIGSFMLEQDNLGEELKLTCLAHRF